MSKEQSERLKWQGTWRRTVLALPKDEEARVDCSNVYLDVLHRPFACTNINLEPYVTNIPQANRMRRLENITYD